MGFLDKLNPFKKKDDLFGDFDSHPDKLNDPLGGPQTPDDIHKDSSFHDPLGASDPFGAPPGGDLPPAGMPPPDSSFPSAQPAELSSKMGGSPFSDQPFSSPAAPQELPKGEPAADNEKHTLLMEKSNMSLELVSAKLDSIKAAIDSINVRLRNLEKMASDSQNPPEPKDKWW